jgi:hypothetical protein
MPNIVIKLFFMPENFSHLRKLEELLENVAPGEIPRALDQAMLSLVLLLRHEPESLSRIIHTYEILFELKTILENQAA